MSENTVLTAGGAEAIGQIVSWTSTSQGVTTTKTGRIVAFVPAGDHPNKYLDPLSLGIAHSRLKFMFEPSQVNRYIVAVPKKTDVPDPYAPENVYYYGPLSSWFEGNEKYPVKTGYTVQICLLAPGADPEKTSGEVWCGFSGFRTPKGAMKEGKRYVRANPDRFTDFDAKIVVREEKYRQARRGVEVLERKIVDTAVIRRETLRAKKPSA